MSRLAPLSEAPINEEELTNCSKKAQTWRNWLKNRFPLLFNKKSDLKVLLSVLGCPLFPVSLYSKQPIKEVSSSAEYIVKHFTAATSCRKLEGMVKNLYATGKVVMSMVDEVSSTGSMPVTGPSGGGVSQKGCFVIWQMMPTKWQIELVVGGQKIIAGSDGKDLNEDLMSNVLPLSSLSVPHYVKNKICVSIPQGLDPLSISAVFSLAEYVGEKRISGTDCFVLKLSADHSDLSERSDNTAEMIKHVMFGYFSQRSGLLVHLEDSYLTRIQSPGCHPTYWETTMATKIEDYRAVEGGVMIAHSGKSSAIITRFGDNLRAGPVITRMEESWVIDDLAFNVPGLDIDCFIPPEEVQKEYPDESLEWKSTLQQ
ncbi:hypothetical protein Leryth_020261 [Lithospermum erythrorhizon]|nr:hypothetical protein Leryth_020261 [Lithospermum erythrorhizon]